MLPRAGVRRHRALRGSDHAREQRPTLIREYVLTGHCVFVQQDIAARIVTARIIARTLGVPVVDTKAFTVHGWGRRAPQAVGTRTPAATQNSTRRLPSPL